MPGDKYPVAIADIKAILVPLHLLALAKEVFPTILIVPVGSYEQTLTEDPIELAMTTNTVIGKNVIGPNYVRALHLALAAFPDLHSFGVHLTRLPIVYTTNPKLTIAENRTIYQRIDDKCTLRIKNPSAEELSRITSISGVQVLREHVRTPNVYLCFCSSEQKLEVEGILVPRSAACGSSAVG